MTTLQERLRTQPKNSDCLDAADRIDELEAQVAALTDERDALRTAAKLGLDALDVGKAVDRFLGWKLPQDFHPDSFISFDREKHDAWGGYPNSWPTGTNLFHAEQARAMFEYCLTDAITALRGVLK